MSHYLSLRGLGQPIAYFPQLSIAIGCVKAGIFLGQMIFWHDKTENELGVYKTSEDITKETGLSYEEQRTARKKLVALGLISETYKRLDHRLYFKFQVEAFDLWFEKVVLAKKENACSRNGESPVREQGKVDIVIQKNTTENTTENKCIYTAPFDFKKSLLENGADEQLVSDFMKIRKNKKATDTQTALNIFISQQQKSGLSLNEVLEICISSDWKSFKAVWIENQKQSKPKQSHSNYQQPKTHRFGQTFAVNENQMKDVN